MISAVVGMAHNNVIGSSNDLPWYLPADLKQFKAITTGHAVVMGRKTYDSIINRLGHALPNRTNIVVTRDVSFKADDSRVVHSLEEAFAVAGDEGIFVIGGEQIFTHAFPFLDRLYVTEIDADIPGDTFFPSLNPTEWHEVSREDYSKDEKNQYDYSFVVLDRQR